MRACVCVRTFACVFVCVQEILMHEIVLGVTVFSWQMHYGRTMYCYCYITVLPKSGIFMFFFPQKWPDITNEVYVYVFISVSTMYFLLTITTLKRLT